MALRVIGAGFGRTGTLSLKAALEELGFTKCYHMTDVLAHPEHAPLWEAAGRGDPIDWGKLFEGYQATVDWPGCAFYEQIIGRYPDAKVILTTRDPDEWYDSAKQTIYWVRSAFRGWTLLFVPRMRSFRRMLDRVIWDGTFHARFEDKNYAIKVFRQHNELVCGMVPRDRLLIYEVREGWAPLCAFLGVPIPDGKPFPRLNDSATFRARIERFAGAVRAVAYAALTVLALTIAWLASRFFF
jgi:Sulfotransferase domain